MASRDIYVTIKICDAAALIVLKCKDSEGRSGEGGNGFDAWLELDKKNDY